MWWAQLLNTITAILDAGAGGGGGSYESIATITASGSSPTASFTSIPSTYKSLQIRFNLRSNSSGWGVALRLNNDTAGNYARHQLYGTGATATADGIASVTSINVAVVNIGTDTTQPTVGIIDLIDYASTTKTKTIRAFSGLDKNGSGEIGLHSGLWNNTAAVNRVDITLIAENFTSGSTFSLYGIKGA
jgi:hypothetical protein